MLTRCVSMLCPSAARDALPCRCDAQPCFAAPCHAPAFRRCSEPWQCSPEPPPCYPEPWRSRDLPCPCNAPYAAPRFALATPCSALPSPADGVLCSCLPMPCTALAMRASLRLAVAGQSVPVPPAMPSSPRKAAARSRGATSRLAVPLPCSSMPSPRGQRHAHAGRCGAPLRSRVAVLRRRPAVRSDALPQPTSALLSNAPAVRRNPQPLLCQPSPSRCCPKPCRCDALLRSAIAALARAFPCCCWPAHCFALARRSGAAQCRRRSSHCPAFASPCSAVPPLIGSPTCLATAMLCLAFADDASPCSALALLCHSTASPSLAIALLRRATSPQRRADHSLRVVPPSSDMPLQRSPEHSRCSAMRFRALPQPFPASLCLSFPTLVSAAALLCCAIAQRRHRGSGRSRAKPSLRVW